VIRKYLQQLINNADKQGAKKTYDMVSTHKTVSTNKYQSSYLEVEKQNGCITNSDIPILLILMICILKYWKMQISMIK